MSSLAMIGWALVVLIRGTTPPVGLAVDIFATQQECRIAGERDWSHVMYRWACEPRFKEDP